MGLTDERFREGKDRPVEMIKAVGRVFGEFQVLLLVLADGNLCGPAPD